MSAAATPILPSVDPMWPVQVANLLLTLPWEPGIAFRPCEERRFRGLEAQPATTDRFRYDAQGRLLAREPDATRSAGRPPDTGLFCFSNLRFEALAGEITYDDEGRVQCIGRALNAREAVCFEYDAESRLVSWANESRVHEGRIRYGADGRPEALEAIVDEDEEFATFTYEGGRLVRTERVTGNIGWDTSNDIRYTYDAVGRLVGVTDVFVLSNQDGQEREGRTRRFEYDENGRLHRCVRSCAGCSSPAADGAVEYRWQGEQLVERRATAADGTVLARVAYSYDCQ